MGNEHSEDTNNYVKHDDWYVNDNKRTSLLSLSPKKHSHLQQRDKTPVELNRKSPLVRAIIRGFKNNITGIGVEIDFFGGTQPFRKKIQSSFNKWSKGYAPDFHGDTNFGGMQGYIVNAMYVDHGALILKYFEKINNKFELRLRVVGQSWIDQSKGDKGLEKDRFGRITAYWIYNNVDEVNQGSEKYKKNEEVIHCRVLDEPESLLGVSEVMSSIRSNKELTSLNNARVTQQTVAAMLALIVKGLKKGEGRLGMKNLQEEDYLEPGMVAYLDDEDVEIETVNPPSIQGAGEIEASLRRDTAIGSGSTYEVATGDFSRVNFASGRFSKQEYKLHIKVLQNHVISIAISKIIEWWIESYRLNNTIKIPNDIEWNLHFPESESISPKEDLEVDIKKVRNGAMTPQDFSRKHGVNFTDMIQQWEEAKKAMDDAGIILDIDPSIVSAAGNIQIPETEETDKDNPSSSNEQKKQEEKDAND